MWGTGFQHLQAVDSFVGRIFHFQGRRSYIVVDASLLGDGFEMFAENTQGRLERTQHFTKTVLYSFYV